MPNSLSILLLIPVLAEKACHEGSCDDWAQMQMSFLQMSRNKEKFEHLKQDAAAPDKDFPCVKAEPQAPRNLTRAFEGERNPRLKPVSIGHDFSNLIHVNTHFHLGAEHCNFDDDEFSLNVDQAFANPKDIIPKGIRPGYFCAPVDAAPTRGTLDPYEFKWCKNVSVGYTYEFHWVYSSAGPLNRSLTGGLGGVFARDLNPGVLVRSQVFRIVNDPTEEYMQYNTTWKPVKDYMLYVGSTTSDSYNNEKCSPYEVTWWVDRQCKELSAQVLDRTCKDLLEFGLGMENDVEPGSSREIVAPFISDNNPTIGKQK